MKSLQITTLTSYKTKISSLIIESDKITKFSPKHRQHVAKSIDTYMENLFKNVLKDTRVKGSLKNNLKIIENYEKKEKNWLIFMV